jgi:hypothetical protein
MDFLEKLFEQHGSRHPGRHDDHDWSSAQPHRDASHGDPRYAHASGHESEAPHAYRGDPHGRSTLTSVLGALAQYKTLCVVAALLLLVVSVGGVIGLVLLLPLAGKLVALVGAQDLSMLLTDLPRLISTLLVDLPKAVLEYLAPLLQLKTALEGKA